MDQLKMVNLEDLQWTGWKLKEGVEVEAKDPARKLGSDICGFRVERLQPGMQASQLHRHHFQEEMLLILSGTGKLRHGDQVVTVKPGDFVLYKAGDPTAHTIVNDGSDAMEFIATGNRVPHEVCEYPEEGTVFVEALEADLPNQPVDGSRERVERWYAAGQDSTGQEDSE